MEIRISAGIRSGVGWQIATMTKVEVAKCGIKDTRKGKVRQVIENELELEKGYQEMAADQEAEAEALEWIEGTAGDVGDEPW